MKILKTTPILVTLSTFLKEQAEKSKNFTKSAVVPNSAVFERAKKDKTFSVVAPLLIKKLW